MTKKRSTLLLLCFVLGLMVLALLACVYEFLIGLPLLIDGKWVHRHTEWCGRNWPFGIPPYRELMYYYYSDGQGRKVQHGPYRQFYDNGQTQMVRSYRHGEPEGTWIEWTENGEKRSEARYEVSFRDGRKVSECRYSSGKLQYHKEELYEGENLVAWKRFENGQWFLDFPWDPESAWPAEPRLRIDPNTGEVSPLK